MIIEIINQSIERDMPDYPDCLNRSCTTSRQGVSADQVPIVLLDSCSRKNDKLIKCACDEAQYILNAKNPHRLRTNSFQITSAKHKHTDRKPYEKKIGYSGISKHRCCVRSGS